VEGVAATSGSLGLAPAHALGGQLSALARGEHRRLVIVVGDGELQTGLLLETLSWLGTAELPGVLVVVDSNGWQSTGRTPGTAPSSARAAFADPVELDGNEPADVMELFDSFTATTPARFAVARTSRWAGTDVSPDEHPAMGFLPAAPRTQEIIRELWKRAES